MYCDCEAPECGGEIKTVTARKTYKCCECGITINPGDRYSRCDGIWEGKAESYHFCESCTKVREKIFQLEDGDCIAFRELHDWIGCTDEWFRHEQTQFASCTIATLVPWLRRGYNGRFELVEEK